MARKKKLTKVKIKKLVESFREDLSKAIDDKVIVDKCCDETISALEAVMAAQEEIVEEAEVIEQQPTSPQIFSRDGKLCVVQSQPKNQSGLRKRLNENAMQHGVYVRQPSEAD